MRRYVLAVVGLAFLLWLLAVTGSVWSADNTYIVNSTEDTNDGSCDALGAGTDCTLWEAINAAVANPGTDTVAFNIPVTDTNYGHNTTGVWTIVLTTTLESPVDNIVDGSTQATNILSDTNPYGPEIEISGENLSSGVSCWIIGSNGTIKGLAINRCPAYAVVVNGSLNTIVGSYIGPDATGSSDVSGTYAGILLGNNSENNTIGGPAEADRNVISAMTGGIRIFQTTGNTTGNVIEGNYIGTDRTGTQPLGNGYGIKIHGGAHDNTIGPNNVIAFNADQGVWVDGASTNGNTITQNSIHGNGDLGIELTFDGNDLVEAPTFSSHVCAWASGTAPVNSTVELFTGPDDQGKTYLISVAADGSGNWSASGFLADDVYLSATATGTGGNTSEFSSVPGCSMRAYVPLIMRGF
jgi:CSLREA domain-containing protein